MAHEAVEKREEKKICISNEQWQKERCHLYLMQRREHVDQLFQTLAKNLKLVENDGLVKSKLTAFRNHHQLVLHINIKTYTRFQHKKQNETGIQNKTNETYSQDEHQVF